MMPEQVSPGSKRGFNVTVVAWFHEEHRGFVDEKLKQIGTRSAFDARGLSDKLDAPVIDEPSYVYHIWDFVMLESWYERFID